MPSKYAFTPWFRASSFIASSPPRSCGNLRSQGAQSYVNQSGLISAATGVAERVLSTFWTYCPQPLPYRITEGLPVTHSESGFYFPRFLAGERGAGLRVTNLYAMRSKSRNTSGLAQDRRTSTAL